MNPFLNTRGPSELTATKEGRRAFQRNPLGHPRNMKPIVLPGSLKNMEPEFMGKNQLSSDKNIRIRINK